MAEIDNIFIQIVEKMELSGNLSAQEAEHLRLSYLEYVKNIAQKNMPEAPQPTQTRAYEYISAPANREPVLKKPLSRDDIRERNLSWILNIGVILILISGLIFSTTTWGMLGSFGRTALLFCACLVFFGASVMAGRGLKLRRTSNAFWVLGSLMLPVSLLSIGYLRLFGDYFSLFGHGRYIFAMFSAAVCLPVFIFSTYKFKSRIFSWLTLIDLSLLWVFFASSFYLSAPVFYLLLLCFSGILIVARQLLKNGRLRLFYREAGLLIQINLILSSLFAVFSYDPAYLYAINIIAAAILFFALSESLDLFGYDYVAALLFNTGIFMLGRDFHSALALYMAVAAAGIIFSGAAAATSGRKSLRFNIISGVTAAAGFVYIAVAMTAAGGSLIVGLIALCVILADVIYLSIRTSNPFIGAVAPFMAIAAVIQSVAVIGHYVVFNYDKAYMLGMAVLLFAAFYIFNKDRRLRVMKISGGVAAVLSMVLMFIICIPVKPLLISLTVIGLIFAAMLYVICITTGSAGLKRFLRYCIPAVLIISLCLLRYAYSIDAVPALPFYFYSAFAVFALSFAAVGRFKAFKMTAYYCAQVMMALFFLLTAAISLIPAPQSASDFTGVSALLFACVFAVAAGCSIFSMLVSDRRAEKYIMLHISLFIMTVLAFWVERFILINFHEDLSRYVLYAAGFLVLAAYPVITRRDLKRQVCYYSCAIAVILLLGSIFTSSMQWYEYAAAVLYAALLCLEMTGCGLELLTLLPLLLIVPANHILYGAILGNRVVCLIPAVLWPSVLMLVGRLKYRYILTSKKIDWFTPAAFLNILLIPYGYTGLGLAHLSVVVPGCLIAAWFFCSRSRLYQGGARCGAALFAVSLLWPYYSLLSSFDLPVYAAYELILLPVVILVYIVLKFTFKGVRTGFTGALEYLIPSLCYFTLLVHLIFSDSLTEAIIIITFGIVSLLYGSLLKTKSALLMGGAVTVAGTILKTKAFWLSVQWWIYLLAAGVILVAFAGVNEYYKNKETGGLPQKARKLLERFKEWE